MSPKLLQKCNLFTNEQGFTAVLYKTNSAMYTTTGFQAMITRPCSDVPGAFGKTKLLLCKKKVIEVIHNTRWVYFAGW